MDLENQYDSDRVSEFGYWLNFVVGMFVCLEVKMGLEDEEEDVKGGTIVEEEEGKKKEWEEDGMEVEEEKEEEW